jgi:hypothetical protein
MARVNAECAVPLEDGSPCRRAACFTCDNWHLVCASHRVNDQTKAIEELCPVCNSHMVQFSAIDDGRSLVRRRKGDLSVAITTFMRAVSARWFPELSEPVESNPHSEASEEI